MKRYILITLLCLLGLASFIAQAETVSQKQAQEMARLFFNEVAGKVTAPPKLIYNGRRLTTNRLFNPFYVYNNPMGGFVIISAENKAFPILGYSLKDSFDPEIMGETEKALLASYAREIELVRYDSDNVPQAERAWIDYPRYVKEILSSRYNATDPIISVNEADQIMEYAIEDDSAIFSDIYTPDQWREMITDELSVKMSVPLWIINGENVMPAVVYGWQNYYFRIEMTRRNSWLMRLNATENIPSNMVSAVMRPIPVMEKIIEETPFAELDIFTQDLNDSETKRRNLAHTDITIMGSPRLTPLGGSHYEIVLPENIQMVRIYDLGGAMVRRFYISGSPTAYIDLSAETPGFYIINAIDKVGQPYSFKVYR